MHQTVVASHHIRTGFHRLLPQLFIHIRRRPVIAVHHADINSPRRFDTQIPCPSLMMIFFGGNHPKHFGILLLKSPKNLQRIIRGGVIHRNNFIVFHRLPEQGCDTIF